MRVVRLQLAMSMHAGYQRILNPDTLHQRLARMPKTCGRDADFQTANLYSPMTPIGSSTTINTLSRFLISIIRRGQGQNNSP